MKHKPDFRYVVYDECQQPIRKFYTKLEAMQFLQDGWKVVSLPKTPVIDWDNYEPAPF